jgi:hypothetical protein
MSQSTTYEYGPGNGEARPRRQRTRWRPLEVVAVVLGFIVFWPIGLALLLWKLWRSKNGQPADLVQAARNLEEKVMHSWPEKARRWGCARRQDASNWQTTSWGFGSGNFSGLRSTGNAAFDEWRDGELARLEEERRKLEAAEREFSDHIESLRRAKDCEEFEAFMRARGGKTGSAPNGDRPAA